GHAPAHREGLHLLRDGVLAGRRDREPARGPQVDGGYFFSSLRAGFMPASFRIFSTCSLIGGWSIASMNLVPSAVILNEAGSRSRPSSRFVTLTSRIGSLTPSLNWRISAIAPSRSRTKISTESACGRSLSGSLGASARA